jgi:hypothetical protein
MTPRDSEQGRGLVVARELVAGAEDRLKFQEDVRVPCLPEATGLRIAHGKTVATIPAGG